MSKTKSLIVAFLVVGFAIRVSAQTSFAVSTERLQDQCVANERMDTAKATNDYSHMKEKDGIDGVACMGYVLGTIDALPTTIITASTGKGVVVVSSYSVPNGINAGQGVGVFLKYLRNHPEVSLQSSARAALLASWVEAKLIRLDSVTLPCTGTSGASN